MKKTLLVLTIIFTVISCSKVPITGRKQMNLLPNSMMMEMSLTSYKQVLQENTVLPETSSEVQLVRKVGNNITNSVAAFLKDNNEYDRIEDFEWEYNVLNNDAVNAWCMPGGKIAFYTGILPITKNESGIATVMGHEVAHAVAKHGNERMSQQLAIALGGISLSVAMKEKPEQTRDLFMALYGAGSTLGTLAYSRKHEYEADKMGMVFMAKAGYHPQQAIEFWQRMKAQKGGAKVPQFLSTHPTDDNRIEAMEEFLPEALKYYKK